jgi:hypothetical protein
MEIAVGQKYRRRDKIGYKDFWGIVGTVINTSAVPDMVWVSYDLYDDEGCIEWYPTCEFFDFFEETKMETIEDMLKDLAAKKAASDAAEEKKYQAVEVYDRAFMAYHEVKKKIKDAVEQL